MVEIIGDAVPLAGASAALPKNSVYRSLSGRGRLQAFYDRVLARLPYPVRTQYIHTRFGRTHVTVGGNANGAPLLIIPGMSISGPVGRPRALSTRPRLRPVARGRSRRAQSRARGHRCRKLRRVGRARSRGDCAAPGWNARAGDAGRIEAAPPLC